MPMNWSTPSAPRPPVAPELRGAFGLPGAAHASKPNADGLERFDIADRGNLDRNVALLDRGDRDRNGAAFAATTTPAAAAATAAAVRS